MGWKVCVCTDDLKNVNVHFGRADVGMIYMLGASKKPVFVEERSLSCQENGQDNHSFVANEKIKKVEDCDYILCSKIGNKLNRILNIHNIGVIEYQGDIEHALIKLTRYLSRMV